MDNKRVINIKINSEEKDMMVRNADTLLCALREQLGLTGAKPGCENGDCDTCTVLVDGKPIKSCLMLAVEALDKEILTIEGLKNSPIQKTFIEKGAFQCGYCTCGFVMNIHALLNTKPNASDDTIDEWLSSNLCRCTGYQEIKESVQSLLNQG